MILSWIPLPILLLLLDSWDWSSGIAPFSYRWFVFDKQQHQKDLTSLANPEDLLKTQLALVLASHWHHLLVLVSNWLGEWFGLVQCAPLSAPNRPVSRVVNGTLTLVPVLSCWCSLLLKRRPCQRRWWVRYSNWFSDFWFPVKARFCQLRSEKSITRLEQQGSFRVCAETFVNSVLSDNRWRVNKKVCR